MTPDAYFALLVEELRADDSIMGRYYKFWRNDGEGRHYFRKNYFLRRLEYALAQAGGSQGPIWDVGCGFGTTDIFLALNGYRVHGITIEPQFGDRIPRRLAYWAQHGDISGFTWAYQSLFDVRLDAPAYDRIIVQDTLHHLEPIDEALAILRRALKPGGRIIAIEENGRNLIQRARLFRRRGSRRVIEIYDEGLDKRVLLGNENIRPLEAWRTLAERAGLEVRHYEYIRLLLPPFWTASNYAQRQAQEREWYKRSVVLRDYLYFGLNFTLEHASQL